MALSGKPKASIGDTYGYLTLVEDTGQRTNDGSVIWKCKCVCGKIVYRRSDCINESIRKGCIISCGCKKDKSIGKKYAFDERRIQLARESLGQIDGTTMQGINRKNLNKNNKSGVRGVCFINRKQKWRAEVMLRGQSIERRLFDKKEDAIAWRKHLEEKYFEPIKAKYREEKE